MITAILSSIAGSVAGYLVKAYFSGKAIEEYQAMHGWLLAELARVKTELSALKAKL